MTQIDLNEFYIRAIGGTIKIIIGKPEQKIKIIGVSRNESSESTTFEYFEYPNIREFGFNDNAIYFNEPEQVSEDREIYLNNGKGLHIKNTSFSIIKWESVDSGASAIIDKNILKVV